MRFMVLVLLFTLTSLSVFAQNGRNVGTSKYSSGPKTRITPSEVASVSTYLLGPIGGSTDRLVVLSNGNVLVQACPLNPAVKCTTSSTTKITGNELREIQRLATAAVNNPELDCAPQLKCAQVPTAESVFYVTKKSVKVAASKKPACAGTIYKNEEARQLMTLLRTLEEQILNEEDVELD